MASKVQLSSGLLTATHMNTKVYIMFCLQMDQGQSMVRRRSRVRNYENTPIPYLRVLRHIPGSYRTLLPLSFMLKQRCAVIGGEDGKLTVAIYDTAQMRLTPTLKRLTGHTIFFVQVDARQLGLALGHMEFMARARSRWHRELSPYHPLQIRSLLAFLSLYPV